ncbi:dCTP deaminase [Glycomyces rhizosphaerae]|uniref:Deoxycytidine triphosphate deaminase n=1 Tax=Glycomyces rhizosphaerae TaxID=2054422 RepID=A0ABV7Q561_9ACTN
MYLADVDIRAHLNEINFSCRLPQHPFNPDLQIGPASVDIRIDTVFWVPKRKPPRRWSRTSSEKRWRSADIVDLRRQDVYETQPTLHWRQRRLAPGDTIVINPGESIMARTYEEFSMPEGMAGKLSARVSYSRLGLLVHCGNDFMNPGWRGHHPLQLVNLSGLPIRIAPLFPVAQLCFVTLTQPSSRIYGEGERYMHDDGGPSKWWRDALVQEVVDAYGQDNLPRSVSDYINQAIADGLFSDEQLIRLLEFRESVAVSRFTSGSDFLGEFAEKERNARKRRQVWRGIKLGSLPILLGASLGLLSVQPYGWLHFGFILATVLSLLFASHEIFAQQSEDFFLPQDWRAYKNQEQAKAQVVAVRQSAVISDDPNV